MPPLTRVSQACNQCRTKKRRCDGAKPKCRLCVRLQIECTYAEFDGRSNRAVAGGAAGRHRHSISSRQDGGGSHGSPSSDSNSKTSPNAIAHERDAAVEATSGVISAELVTNHIGSTTYSRDHGQQRQQQQQQQQNQNSQQQQTSSRSQQIAPWNVGLGESKFRTCTCPRLSEVLAWSDFLRLATIYFADVHPFFGAFSQQDFWNDATSAWHQAATDPDAHCNQVLLSSVAAMGSLFSPRSTADDARILEIGNAHLSHHLMGDYTATQDIDGLIIRTLYLRLSVGPRACYISCCMLQGMLQDTLMRVEMSWRPFISEGGGGGTRNVGGTVADLPMYDDNGMTKHGEEQTRLLCAKLLSAWTANEYGRPRPFDDQTITGYGGHYGNSSNGAGRQHSLSGASPGIGGAAGSGANHTSPGSRTMQIPEKAPPGPIWELLRLCALSEAMNPSNRSPPDATALEELLADVCRCMCTHDVVVLSQANLSVVIFRRLRSAGARPSPEAQRRLIWAGERGLAAGRRLAERRQPWHHVANVPFQVLCLLLLLDTRESLRHVRAALDAIRAAARIFDTASMQNTLGMACHLTRLAQQRKHEDAGALFAATGEALGGGSGSGSGGGGGPDGDARSASSIGQNGSAAAASGIPAIIMTGSANPATNPPSLAAAGNGPSSTLDPDVNMDAMEMESSISNSFAHWDEIDWGQVLANENTLWGA